MLQLLESQSNCRIVLVEKTDRLYRNRTDALAFEELIEQRGIEVHLVKENRIIGKDSRSQDKFMHDYYRCSHGRGKCSLPYMREQDVSDHLGELLKVIY